MILCHNFTKGSLEKALSPNDLQGSGWIHLSAPKADETALIHEKFGLPLSYLTAALDYNERPRLAYMGDTLLIILRAPVTGDKNLKKPLSTSPVAFILRDNLLVTVCLKNNVSDMLCASPPQPRGERSAIMLMLTLFMRICGAYISYLKILDDFVGTVENTMQESMHNKELLRMLHVDKTLIYFLTALKGNQTVLEKLRSGAVHSASSHEKSLLDDVLIENKQATDMTEIYTEIIGGIGDTFSAMVSNNLNKVMKILTSLTIVFMVPTIISSLYGMNVPLPGSEGSYSFAVLSLLCLGITLVVYRILKKKDWM